ncbi:MAG TPA: helix-hairpin-helix domain-containing protein [Gaiellaceae bacterium]|nr:helix-hairpin-helix domain-containing protein [Gaiellaceae bacterium]
MPAISRDRALAYAVVLLLFLTVAGRMALAGDGRPGGTAPAAPSGGLEIEEEPARELVVHVVGAVVAPGLYRLPEGSRIDDAIARAGGARPRAALELVNLASPVADGQQVIVPARGRGGEVASLGASGEEPPGKVRLNSATLEELETLPGVGPVTAQRILDYREANGAFGSIEELDAVPGIGPATLEQLLPLVDL